MRTRWHLRRIISSNEAYLAADPGRAYALYFPDRAKIQVDQSKAPGQYEGRWIDIQTGDWGKTETLGGGKSVSLTSPADHHALAITRVSEN